MTTTNPAAGGLARHAVAPGRGSLPLRAADRLAELVAAAAPGQRLGSKEDLRRRCQVSVGTFNEAVRIAQARGLVTLRPGPGGGLFAAVPSPMVRLGNVVLALDGEPTSVADAVRIRDALDPLLVQDALDHASPADVERMRAQVDAMVRAERGGDVLAFVRANWRLHAEIAAVSPSPVLRSFYTSLLELIESHTLAVLTAEDRPLPRDLAQRRELHHDLVESIARRDRAGATRLIAEHTTARARQGDAEG